jgi:ABC-type transport system substrate-binding protein
MTTPEPRCRPASRTGRVVAVLAAIALLVTGCGNGDGGASGDGGGDTETLRVAIAEPVGVLDPHVFTGNFIVLDMLYEPLVRYGDGGELEPGLAESWEISDDGLTVTFDLRDEVSFHDGTAFDADAVKWNLDRWVRRGLQLLPHRRGDRGGLGGRRRHGRADVVGSL